jgi:peptidoglycan/LPS O-acetylase OafA/YrhL
MSRAAPLPGLDLLRAVAIVWTMLFHSFVVGGLGPDWSWASRFGWMGVDLFFVLSGFLIGEQVLAPLARGEALSLRGFWWRRAWRILPAYLATLGLYLAWPAFREAPGMAPAWKFLSFTVNLDIDYLRHTAFSHAWSLCVEEHFYLAFPLVALGLARPGVRWSAGRTLALAALLVAGGLLLRAWAWQRGMTADPDMAHRNWFVEDLYYPTWCRLDGLLAGVLLAACKVGRPAWWAAARARPDALALAGAAGLLLSLRLFDDRVGALANTVGWPVLSASLALLVAAAAGPGGVLGRWRVPGAAGLATISFSLYLVHKPVYHLVQDLAGPQLAGRGLLTAAAYGGAAVAAGALLYALVERPGLRWRDRHAAARTDAPSTVRP